MDPSVRAMALPRPRPGLCGVIIKGSFPRLRDLPKKPSFPLQDVYILPQSGNNCRGLRFVSSLIGGMRCMHLKHEGDAVVWEAIEE